MIGGCRGIRMIVAYIFIQKVSETPSGASDL